MRKPTSTLILVSIVLLTLFSGCASSQVKAARRGDLDALQEYLDDGGDINAPEKGGTTLLMYAAENGQNPTILFLLDRDAVISLKDDRGRTAFLYAVIARQESSAELLLSRGAAVNVLLSSGDSALILAAGSENLSMIKMLLVQGADLNQTNNGGWSALTIALSKDAQRPSKLSALTRHLISLGADIDMNSDVISKIAFTAAASGNVDVLNYLLDLGYNLESRNDKNETLLLTAVSASKTDAVRMLLQRGADWDVKDASGWSLLMKSLYQSASKGEKPDAVAKLLMEYGAIPEGNSPQGIRTAFVAAEKGAQEVLELLLIHGLSPTVRDDQGNSLLMAGIHHPDVVRLMLNKNVPVNAKNKQSMTARLLASRFNQKESLTQLILAGADLNQSDSKGQNALFYTARSADVEMSRKLLVAGISVFSTDKAGNTALHVASESGVPATVRLLLTSGIYVDSSNAKGETPLIVCARNPQHAAEIRQILITAGAKVPVVAVAPVVQAEPETKAPAAAPAPIPKQTAAPAPVVKPAPAPVVTPAPEVKVETPAETQKPTPESVAETPEQKIAPIPAPVNMDEPAPPAGEAELNIHYGWPSINPSAVRGWNNSDKLKGYALLKIAYADSSDWFHQEQIRLPMKGVNADRFEQDLSPHVAAGKACRATLTLPTQKGNALVAEITAVPDVEGKMVLFFDKFRYEK
ncbi:ankyrin repeat domain-containing protein [Oceanispirochaeta sp.]|uniref:ankyrin repeat domain-containing protein n=1 Tax=Oceanispirochaeta sp. TaxID=2035350 RepID=UPI002601809B|nr:ankyrin repeat domain-containing protein [Oceanispirochaeta sp.]MDA3957426.1 ankyrin repeat domain-containing protein [Oceanispirochaeta sp.]